MSKPLMDKLLKEVGDLGDRMMLGLPYTAGGGVISPGTDIFNSPDVSQNPDAFAANGTNNPDQYKDVEADDKSTYLTYAPPMAGSQSNVNVGIPDDQGKNPNIAKQPEDVIDLKKGTNDIKFKVTPDEVIAGINAELKGMVFKRPDVAKALVIKNLRNDPKYYSNLNFLGMGKDDVNESRKHMTKQERVIADIVKNMWQKKQNKRR